MKTPYKSKWQLHRLIRQKKLCVRRAKGICERITLPKDCRVSGLLIHLSGTDNEIRIGKNCSFTNSQIMFYGSHHRLIIGDDCTVSGTNFCFTGEHSTARIGDRVQTEGSFYTMIALSISSGATLSVGDDSVISESSAVFTTDYHGMYDGESHRRINPDKDTVIGDHVLLFRRVTVLKGAQIADGCSVETGSMVSGKFTEPNCLLSGSPAKVIRHNVLWHFEKSARLPAERTDFGD